MLAKLELIEIAILLIIAFWGVSTAIVFWLYSHAPELDEFGNDVSEPDPRDLPDSN